jgi:hypothetical protein
MFTEKEGMSTIQVKEGKKFKFITNYLEEIHGLYMNKFFFIELPQEKRNARVTIFQNNRPNKQLEFMWVLNKCMFK